MVLKSYFTAELNPPDGRKEQGLRWNNPLDLSSF